MKYQVVWYGGMRESGPVKNPLMIKLVLGAVPGMMTKEQVDMNVQVMKNF